VLHMAMKSTVVIVAVTLAIAILLAVSLLIAIERRGEVSLWPIADGPVLHVRLVEPVVLDGRDPD